MSAGVEERLLRSEERWLLLSFLASTALLTQAFEAPYLLAVGVVGLVCFVPLRRIKAAAPAWVEAFMSIVAAGAATPIAISQKDAALGLSIFLLVIMGVRLVAPRSDRERGTTAAIGVVLAGVTASEAVAPSFALLMVLSLCVSVGWANARNLRFRGVGDQRRDVSGVRGPVLIGPRGNVPVAAPNRLFVGNAPRGRKSLVWTLALAGVLLLAMLQFAATPRLGANLLARRRSNNRQSLSGFSGQVSLDGMGKIRENSRVAFRVEVPRSEGAGRVPYWRGRALDHYRRGNWHVSPYIRGIARKLTDQGEGEGFLEPMFRHRHAGERERERYTFYLESLGTSVLFAPGEVERFTFQGARPFGVVTDPFENYSTRRPYNTSMVYSVDTVRQGQVQRRRSRPLQSQVEAFCRRMPPDLDQPRLAELARELLGEGVDLRRARNDPLKTALRLEQAIRARYRYTLDRKRTEGTEPIEDFLYHNGEGHCELFASSMVMLLRLLRIPARLVTGFYGGEYDGWSQTYTVRQSSAHAWVEAWTGERWDRFDPTPPDERVPASSAFERLRANLTWLELRWFNYVISFDAYDQRRGLEVAQAWIEESGGPAKALGRLAGFLGVLAALLLLGVAALRRLWVSRDRPPPELRRLLAALARRGHPRRRGETLLEVVRRAEPNLGLKGELEPGVRAYYANRFGPGDAAAAPLDALAARVNAARPAANGSGA